MVPKVTGFVYAKRFQVPIVIVCEPGFCLIYEDKYLIKKESSTGFSFPSSKLTRTLQLVLNILISLVTFYFEESFFQPDISSHAFGQSMSGKIYHQEHLKGLENGLRICETYFFDDFLLVSIFRWKLFNSHHGFN